MWGIQYFHFFALQQLASTSKHGACGPVIDQSGVRYQAFRTEPWRKIGHALVGVTRHLEHGVSYIYIYISEMLCVFCTYLQLPPKLLKCRQIDKTLGIWVYNRLQAFDTLSNLHHSSFEMSETSIAVLFAKVCQVYIYILINICIYNIINYHVPYITKLFPVTDQWLFILSC